MEFEVLHRSKKKQLIIAGVAVVLILVAIVIGITFARYRVSSSASLVYGEVNYSRADLDLVAVYLEREDEPGVYDNSIDVPPAGEYLLNSEKSTCSVSGETDASITIQYVDGKLNFLGLTKRGTKCHVYFDKIRDTQVPVISNVTSSVTQTSITVNVTASDNEGVAKYFYSINNGNYVESTSSSHTFNNLTAGTSYSIKIYVTDESGNESEVDTRNISTKSDNASDIILADKTISTARNGAITGTLTTNTTGTVYSVADDWGTSYVYAGAPTDNWVQFAGYYWRIIRINGDGSIRLIYNGTSTATTGTSTQIQTSAYNSTYNDNAYVGYMYGSTGASSYSATHANTNNSTIKGILDNWYKTNIVDKGHSDKVSTEAGFCNDRKTQSGVMSGYGTTGYGTNATTYAPLGRLMSNGSWKSSQTPSLKCSQIGNDMFTVSGSSKGNHKLTYPIGLITSDEVVLAGGFAGSSNNSYYLYTGEYYWTMSPYFFSGSRAYVFYVYSNGGLNNVNVNIARGVRPVINLKADITITGEGTSSNPYKVSS